MLAPGARVPRPKPCGTTWSGTPRGASSSMPDIVWWVRGGWLVGERCKRYSRGKIILVERSQKECVKSDFLAKVIFKGGEQSVPGD